MSAVGLVLLAAGASTRLGSPKQLLRYAGQTLLRRAVESALASKCSPVIVVLGANAALLQPELQGLPVQVAENTAWEQGMGSSLRIGLETLLAMAEVGAVLCMLCDQPYLSASTLNALVTTWEQSGAALVASEYGNTLGAPALFDRSLFPEILNLQGADGAKKIIQRHRALAAVVPFPEGAFDIDTPADYQNLSETSNI